MCIKTGGMTQCPIHEHDQHFHGLVTHEGAVREKWECACGYQELRPYNCGVQDTEWRR